MSKNINGIEIFRASKYHEDYVYSHIKNKVFEKHESKVYTDKHIIKDIVNYMYKEYYKLLDEYLPLIDKMGLAYFLLGQYELYGQVEIENKKELLSSEDTDFWQSYGGYSRRAIKHLIELTCMQMLDKPNNNVIELHDQENAISICFIAIEELVSLYMRSESYYRIYDNVTLVLNEKDHLYFNVLEDGDYRYDSRKELMHAEDYLGIENILRSPQSHGEIINESFKEAHFISYTDSLGMLDYLINISSNSSGVCRLPLREIIGALSDAFNITDEQIRAIIDGFSLTAHKMLMDGRELYKPKQEYRAFKRGFFIIVHEGEEFILFSKMMAGECLGILISEVCFKKIPTEWQSKIITKSLGKLSRMAGAWFEKTIERNLELIGVQGEISVKKLKFNDGKKIFIPGDVGEIDYIGFLKREKMLVVVEAKQVGFSSEPRMYIDDLDKFLHSDNNYIKKFQKKIDWVVDNKDNVCKYLGEKLKDEVNVESIGYVLLTHYPLFISTKIKSISCMSLTKFMMTYENEEKWTFTKTPKLT